MCIVSINYIFTLSSQTTSHLCKMVTFALTCGHSCESKMGVQVLSSCVPLSPKLQIHNNLQLAQWVNNKMGI